MKYQKMGLEQLKKFYGPHAKLEADNPDYMKIPRGGKNCGEYGVPNVYFHFNFAGTLLNKNGQPVDITKGFLIHDLAKDIYTGFDKTTVVVPGCKIWNEHSTSPRTHFQVTLDPDKVTYVLIGRRRNQDIAQDTKDLAELSDFSCLGKMKEGDNYCWDYFIFPIAIDYNYVLDRDDKLISDAKYAYCGRENLRPQMIREYLMATFGDLSQIIDAQSNMPIESGQKQIFQWHYKDELYHERLWVLDPDGRPLEPDTKTQHGELGGEKFCNPKISLDETWDNVDTNCIVIRYRRRSISEPAEYSIVRRPKKITRAQLDRIIIIEQILRQETKKIVNKHDLLERVALRGPETPWSQQIRKSDLATPQKAES